MKSLVSNVEPMHNSRLLTCSDPCSLSRASMGAQSVLSSSAMPVHNPSIRKHRSDEPCPMPAVMAFVLQAWSWKTGLSTQVK